MNEGRTASRVGITLAMAYYDHVAALEDGTVAPVGINLRVLTLPVEEIFHRFLRYREWEASEMSLGKYVSLCSQGDDSMVGLPVFPSRVFRHSAIYIRKGEIAELTELRGKRIGIAEWAQTATVYMRALLVHDAGVPLDSVQWTQAGVNQPGRREKVRLNLPPGVELSVRPDRSLNDMLLDGEIDAVFSAHPPASFENGDGRIAGLFTDPVRVEDDYAQRTGIVPIMHLIVLRRDITERHPWVIGNLLTAFNEARTLSVARLAHGSAGPGSRIPILWTDDALARTRRAFGGDAWPYGIEENRRTLDAFLQWSYEQGVAHRRLQPEDLFPEATRTSYRV